VRAETEEEVLKLVTEHAKSVHQLEDITDEIGAIIRKVMRDE